MLLVTGIPAHCDLVGNWDNAVGRGGELANATDKPARMRLAGKIAGPTDHRELPSLYN
jgi:hypothetical protein